MKRDFTIGSEWLFYKIYCGYTTADELLKAIIGPLSKRLAQQGLIDNWFFIRYADHKVAPCGFHCIERA